MAQAELVVMRGTSKATGQRVWAVQSTSGSKAAGCPVFHILHWDEASASWVCPCPARKPCVHMRLASAASKADTERDAALLADIEAEDSWQSFPSVDAMFDALTAPQDCIECGKNCKDEKWGGKCVVCGRRLCDNCTYQFGTKLSDLHCRACTREMILNPDYDDSNPRRDELEVLMKAEPIIVRHDTGPRLFRGLPERVKEEM